MSETQSDCVHVRSVDSDVLVWLGEIGPNYSGTLTAHYRRSDLPESCARRGTPGSSSHGSSMALPGCSLWVLGLSAFLGIVLQTRSHALKVSVGPSRANFSKDQQV